MTATTKRSLKQQLIGVGIIVTLLISVSLIFIKPLLDGDPRTNLGYLAWKKGWGGFSPEYVRLAGGDLGFRSQVIGQSLEEVRQKYKFPLIDGESFPSDTYRGRHQVWSIQRNPSAQYYWFDEDDGNFGYCFRVENGTITHFLYVKG